MGVWNPWHGCHRCSEGCQFCYIHKGDARRGVDTNLIARTEQFDAPIRRTKKGEYKMKSGQLVYVCFGSDFLIEEADAWRAECWAMMRERADLTFLFLTKRISRLMACAPSDWGDGYDNVIIGCSVENQARADELLSLLQALPIKHKNVICQPLIEKINIEKYLPGMSLVVVGGESDKEARPLDYDWVLDIRQQCIRQGVPFDFRQCGTHFIKDGASYTLNVRTLCAQARKAAINWPADRNVQRIKE